MKGELICFVFIIILLSFWSLIYIGYTSNPYMDNLFEN